MNTSELKNLGATLAAIADGAEWECQWAVDGWGPPMGRDIEYCISNRIAIRIKGGNPTPTVETFTRRERIAVAAMSAIISKSPFRTSDDYDPDEDEAIARTCRGATGYADMMIAQLDRKEIEE